MYAPMQSIVNPSVPCKCCGGEARLFGVVDFHKNCAYAPRFAEPSGIPIYYHRCKQCGFLFTIAFDSFSTEEFTKWIYNDQYKFVDPDYAEVRPGINAAMVRMACGEERNIRVLDYGCGNGRTAEILRAAGFRNVETYDPIVPAFAVRPSGRFDLVLALEVTEHTPTPVSTFADLESFMSPDGMILISTLPPPTDLEKQGLSWWYVAPRNGHISFYTPQAIRVLASRLQLNFVRFAENWHGLWHQPPKFIQHLKKISAS